MTSAHAQSTPQAATVFNFGTYEVNLSTLELRDGGRLVNLEPQVFALLAYLVQHPRQMLSKDELLDELWGHRHVSESALATQVKALRRALGDDGRAQKVIRTVRGRGYEFLLDPDEVRPESGAEQGAPPVQHNLPRERTRLFGRQHDVEQCARQVAHYRLTTILGIGGTGKTRLAGRVGRELLHRYADGVWFVDLIPFTSRAALETGIAATIGLALDTGASREQIIAALEHRRLLLILDNCEHLRDETANLLNDLLEFTIEPVFLATSRDPLDLPDEHRYALGPLETHIDGSISPAAELFMTTAERHGVRQASASAHLIGQICEQLDGLPLAIELAAAQLRHLSLGELAARLSNRFEVLAGRERTASGRQSNLVAVLEDTWQMLTANEQALLGQLAIFPAQFTITDVEEVMGGLRQAELSAALARLVDLCLTQRASREGAWWRVLETVRLFTSRKLDAQTLDHSAKRHADWCLQKLGVFPDDQWDNLNQADWCLQHYADLERAETYFRDCGELINAVRVCTGTGLMVQLEDGAWARERLDRAQRYLREKLTPYWQARLHAIAGLCAQANRSPPLLVEHTDHYLQLAQSLDEPALLANALLMKSLSTVFVNPEQAFEQLQQSVALGEQIENRSIVDSSSCFRAWLLAVQRDYAGALDLAHAIVDRFDPATNEIDNPAYNSMGIIVTCTLLSEPASALAWAERIRSFPAASSFWGIQLLFACVHATNGQHAVSAAECLQVKARLNRATRDEFPDMLVAAAVLAQAVGETQRTRRWLATIRKGRLPIQMYHTICLYRQLCDAQNFDRIEVDLAPTYDEVREEVTGWLQTVADGKARPTARLSINPSPSSA